MLARTASTPGLPLITRGDVPQDELAALRETLAEVAADPALTDVRDPLLLAGFAFLPPEAYADVMALEQAAAGRGYAVLA